MKVRERRPHWELDRAHGRRGRRHTRGREGSDVLLAAPVPISCAAVTRRPTRSGAARSSPGDRRRPRPHRRRLRADRPGRHWWHRWGRWCRRRHRRDHPLVAAPAAAPWSQRRARLRWRRPCRAGTLRCVGSGPCAATESAMPARPPRGSAEGPQGRARSRSVQLARGGNTTVKVKLPAKLRKLLKRKKLLLRVTAAPADFGRVRPGVSRERSRSIASAPRPR